MEERAFCPLVITSMRPTCSWSLFVIFYLYFGAQSAVAAPPCLPTLQHPTPVGSSLASAGFFANLRGARNSINVQMNSLLGEAKAAAAQLAEGAVPCIPGCSTPVVSVIFESTPNISLADYREFSSCQAHHDTTKTEPIVYAQRLFSSEEEAKEWYKDLTLGDGPDGEDLYRRCPGRCSPSYSSTIYQHLGRYVVTTTIVCGHARDKDDDQYRLRAAVRWVCP